MTTWPPSATVAQDVRPGSDTINTTQQRRGGTGITSGLVILFLVWLIVTPILAFSAGIAAAAFFGETPSAEEMAQARALWFWAMIIGLGVPIAGITLAGAYQRTRALWAFVPAFLLTMALVVAVG